jgi:hypothetical protein
MPFEIKLTQTAAHFPALSFADAYTPWTSRYMYLYTSSAVHRVTVTCVMAAYSITNNRLINAVPLHLPEVRQAAAVLLERTCDELAGRRCVDVL